MKKPKANLTTDFSFYLNYRFFFMLARHFFKPFLITCNKRRNSALQNFGSDQVIDGLVTKKSMFSSKADGYFHDVILIFSRGKVFHGPQKIYTA